ncbi:hypothetical protein L596_013482 [Steinernema carpocapsae]|uniref:Uncharacterized protein n=1 Tax=Steinernema carpocapsae TaxID=34508 RepID=A0A4U5P0A2_STECR|nr:hypothetical protein L596_013482 [Steinernema carpocapsae]
MSFLECKVTKVLYFCETVSAAAVGHYQERLALRSFRENEHSSEKRRLTIHGKGYGVKISDDDTTYEKFKLRHKMLEQKLKVCDWVFSWL